MSHVHTTMTTIAMRTSPPFSFELASDMCATSVESCDAAEVTESDSTHEDYEDMLVGDAESMVKDRACMIAARKTALLEALTAAGCDSEQIDRSMCKDYIDGKSLFEDVVSLAIHVSRQDFFEKLTAYSDIHERLVLMRERGRGALYLANEGEVVDTMGALASEQEDHHIVVNAQYQSLVDVASKDVKEREPVVAAMPISVRQQYTCVLASIACTQLGHSAALALLA